MRSHTYWPHTTRPCLASGSTSLVYIYSRADIATTPLHSFIETIKHMDFLFSSILILALFRSVYASCNISGINVVVTRLPYRISLILLDAGKSARSPYRNALYLDSLGAGQWLCNGSSDCCRLGYMGRFRNGISSKNRCDHHLQWCFSANILCDFHVSRNDSHESHTW